MVEEAWEVEPEIQAPVMTLVMETQTRLSRHVTWATLRIWRTLIEQQTPATQDMVPEAGATEDKGETGGKEEPDRTRGVEC